MKNFNENWINLLTRGNRDLYERIRKNSKCETLAIMQLRRQLMNEAGRGQKITREALNVANIKKETYLMNLLQEMFLEPVEMKDIEYLYKKIVEKGFSIEEGLDKLFDRHIEDRGTRLLSIVSTL